MITYNWVAKGKAGKLVKGSLFFTKDKILFATAIERSMLLSGGLIMTIVDLFKKKKFLKQLDGLTESQIEQYIKQNKGDIILKKDITSMKVPKRPMFSNLWIYVADGDYNFATGGKKEKMQEARNFLVSAGYKVKD